MVSVVVAVAAALLALKFNLVFGALLALLRAQQHRDDPRRAGRGRAQHQHPGECSTRRHPTTRRTSRRTRLAAVVQLCAQSRRPGPRQVAGPSSSWLPARTLTRQSPPPACCSPCTGCTGTGPRPVTWWRGSRGCTPATCCSPRHSPSGPAPRGRRRDRPGLAGPHRAGPGRRARRAGDHRVQHGMRLGRCRRARPRSGSLPAGRRAGVRRPDSSRQRRRRRCGRCPATTRPVS